MEKRKLCALASVFLLSGNLLTGCTRQTTTPNMGRSEVREMAPATLRELRPGQSIGYYVNQFESMGYTVKNADYQTEKTIYELTKGKDVEAVTLMHQPEQRMVSQVETKRLGWLSTGMEEKNIAVDKFKQDLEKLPTGKSADEYVPMLEKYGTVTEYKLHHADAVVDVTSEKNRYKVKLNIDPATMTVTDVSLEKGILNIAG